MQILKTHITVQEGDKEFQLVESLPVEPTFINEYQRNKYRSKPGPKSTKPVYGILWGTSSGKLGYTPFSTAGGNPVHTLAGGSRQFWIAIKSARYMEFREVKTK
jgi:hypothetical protein